MKLKGIKYGLKLITLGTEVKKGLYKTYFRYSTSIDHKQVIWQRPAEYLLTKEQVELINENKLGGNLQEHFDNIKANIKQVINGLIAVYNICPTPQQLDEFYGQAQHFKNIDWYINQYLQQLQVKASTKKLIARHLRYFKTYYEYTLTKQTLQQIISDSIIKNFGKWLQESRKIVSKRFGLGSVHLVQRNNITFLNWIAKAEKLPTLHKVLKSRPKNQQYRITTADYQRLLDYSGADKYVVIQDMLYINWFIGLRLSELCGIHKNNIQVNGNHITITFTEWKLRRPRTVVIVDERAMLLISKYCDSTNDLLFDNYKKINKHLHNMAKLVFREETITLYNDEIHSEVSFLKYKKVTSHIMRRLAVQTNIIKYGIDTAKSLSGHSTYEVVKNYANDILDTDILLQKLLEEKKRPS